jgi:hypothetical protein
MNEQQSTIGKKSEAQRQRLALAALERFGWNQGDAAHSMGWRRETLNRKLREWGGPEGLRRAVAAQPYSSQPAQESHVIGHNSRTRKHGGPVPASASAVLTSTLLARRLVGVEQDVQEVGTVRIPPISIEFDADEDLFISQEIAQGRLTGGARTRSAVVRMAVRALMERRREEAEEQSR